MSAAIPLQESTWLHDPDVQLMLEVRDDNASAFERLVARYQVRLVNLLEHVLRKKDLAEDLAQEVFLRVFRGRKKYTPGAKFSTWLFTIANNVALNAIRSQSRRKEISAQALRDPMNSGFGLSEIAIGKSSQRPARKLDQKEMSTVVRAAMETLNERQRMAIVLCKFEGLSYEEIATTMQMSPKAVKSLLARARDNLRMVLAPYVEGKD